MTCRNIYICAPISPENMKEIIFETPMNVEFISHLREHHPDYFYLHTRGSGSEPIFLFQSAFIKDQSSLFETELAEPANTLLRLHTQLKEAEQRVNSSGKKELDLLIKEINALKYREPHSRYEQYSSYKKINFPFGKHNCGDVSEISFDDLLSEQLELFYVHLPWNKVKLEAIAGSEKKGYFIPYGWSPILKELYFAGPDFVPYKSQEEIKKRLKNTPLGRGIPDDILQTATNCGPSAIAAYTNKSCKEIIEKSPAWREKGVIPIGPTLELLNYFAGPHKSIKLKGEVESLEDAFHNIKQGLAFIQFRGSRGKFEGNWPSWSQAYAHTHWVAYDNGLVFDFNARHRDGTLGDWTSEDAWIRNIIPKLWRECNNGYYVRNILVPEQNLF